MFARGLPLYGAKAQPLVCTDGGIRTCTGVGVGSSAVIGQALAGVGGSGRRHPQCAPQP